MVDQNGTMLAQILNFAILVIILAKFAYKPLMQAIAERQARISESLENAKKEQEQAEQLRLEYQEKIADARNQAQAIIDKAVKFAEQSKEEILSEARAEHARMLKAAQEEISREQERALAELKNEVVVLSLAAAAKVIEKNLDQEANSRLVGDFIDKLDAQKIGGLPC